MARLSSSAREVTSSRRPERGLPPASTSSSQFCRRRRRRKRRRGNRLTSPPDHAGAARPDRSDKSDLCKESARAPSVMGATRRGGGATAALRACRCGRAADPRISGPDPRPPVAALASLPLSAFPARAHSSNTPTRTRRAKTPGSCTGWGPRAVGSLNERLPHAASRSLIRPDALRVPSIPPQLSRAFGLPGKTYLLFLPFPQPLLGFLYSSRSVRFLKDMWETTVFVRNLPVCVVL